MDVVPVFLLTGIFLSISSEIVSAVECYICSWNSLDSHENSDYPDVCTSDNFDPERVRTHDCVRGCEIISMRDPNGELEMFYRNCATDKEITYVHKKKRTKLNEEEVYTCDFDLCNSTSNIGTLTLLEVTLIIIIWFYSFFV